MKISVFSLVFKDRNIEESVRLAREIGYDGIELWGSDLHFPASTTKEKTREIKSMTDYYGLEIPVIGSYVGGFSMLSDPECNKAYEDLARYLELMDVLGCSMIRVDCGGPNIFLSECFHYDKAQFWMRKCADLASRYGKRIAMEIHNGSLIETVDAADAFIKELDRKNVGFIVDPGNMYITDTDYGMKAVEILGNKIFHVHVKDEMRIEDDVLPGAFHSRTIYGDEVFQQRLLGEGDVDHFSIFKGLLNMKYDGFLSSECHAAVPDIEKARHELNEIRKQMKVAEESMGQLKVEESIKV